MKITSPDDAALPELCERLSALASETDLAGAWPGEQLRLCGEAGVFEWFIPEAYGGQAWSTEAITRGYLALSRACLATTFVITQRTGACSRLAGGENEALRARLLPPLATAESFATVGISHLTTSRRHLRRPVLTAERVDGGYRLDGFSPWVTGAEAAEHVILGAVLMVDGEPTDDQLLACVPTDQAGVATPEPPKMVALSSSRTGRVDLDGVFVGDDSIVAGPIPEVMNSGSGGTTGGPQTSTLAVGAASASLEILASEAQRRPDLEPVSDALAAEHAELCADLLATSRGEPRCSNESLRSRSNDLVLRASQAALTATKGAGFLAEAPAGRLCREALFFLVWSCPQPVQNAKLCELAGIAE